jgi:hypothetical protein
VHRVQGTAKATNSHRWGPVWILKPFCLHLRPVKGQVKAVLIGAPRSAQRTALLRDHTDRLVVEPVFEEHLGVFVPAVWRRLS